MLILGGVSCWSLVFVFVIGLASGVDWFIFSGLVLFFVDGSRIDLFVGVGGFAVFFFINGSDFVLGSFVFFFINGLNSRIIKELLF